MFGPQAFPVTDRIWCVRRRSYQTCSYIVRTDSGAILIDAGMDSNGHDVRYGLSKMGLSTDCVRAILLTHWHNDHAAGASAIQTDTDVPVYCHEFDAPSMTRESAPQGLRGWLSDVILEWGLFVLFKGLLGEATPRAISSPKFVNDGDTLLDDFTAIESFGHTPGHMCYYYRPERALFAGDALAVVGGRVRFMARLVTPDLVSARESMAKCLALEIDVLCPGHRRPIAKDTQGQCRKTLEYVQSNGHWPFFG